MNNKKQLLMIINPVAGTKRLKRNLADVLVKFTESGYICQVQTTQKDFGAKDWVLKCGKNKDMIVCGGGDGTLNDVIAGCIELGIKPEIGYIPCGSTNDFAGTVGIPTNIRTAAKMSMDGKPFFCDAGKINDKYFAYVAAFGAFTSVSYDTSQDFKNIFGHLAYVIEGIRRLPSIKPIHMKITFDDKVIEDDFILGMVTNSLQVGGIKFSLGTAISLNDGMFEVLLVKKPQTAASFQAMISAFMAQSIDKTNDIISFKASKIRFETDDPVPWTVDGEHGGDIATAEIENLTRAFSVII